MMQSGLKRECFISIIALIYLIVFVTPISAQYGNLMAGRIDGEKTAREKTNKTLWFIIGAASGCTSGIGMIAAYIYEPSPSAMMLIGKTPEYAAGYIDAYRTTAKKIQTRSAWTGCIITGSLWILMMLFPY